MEYRSAVVGYSARKYCVVHNVEVPELTPGMMLCEVSAVAINPADAKTIDYSPVPGVGGLDFAGKVIKVGENVERFKAGDRVFGFTFGLNAINLGTGAFSDIVLATADLCCRIPLSMAFEQATTLGLSLGTAGYAIYQQLGLPMPGSTLNGSKYVLVSGGATSTGQVAIQLLKLSGLKPIATCSSGSMDMIKSIGAVETFDYRSTTCGREIRNYTEGSLEHVLDCITTTETMTMCYDAIGANGGKYTSLDPPPTQIKYTRRDIDADWITAFALFGHPVKMNGVYGRPSQPKSRQFASKLYALAEGFIQRGLLKPTSFQIRTGGLDGVQDGIEEILPNTSASYQFGGKPPNNDTEDEVDSAHDTRNMAVRDDWVTEPVAITGIGCRFPGGASSPSKLWQILQNPPDLLAEIPSTKFNPNGFYHAEARHHGTSNVLHSYLLKEDPRLFDHEFFNIHPKEAESMDPQQRILLETVYEAIEDAGYSVSELRGSSTAVFVGQMTDDYYDLVNRDVKSAPQYTATGCSRAIVANRVSYFFDWRGPSVNIDTACSSSLVALHMAVQALRNNECQTAVVAGVNLILGPEKYIYESQLSMLSPTGRSRMWDSSADGYARGEGFAAVVLKRLDRAISDNDHIDSIVRETGINQDGRSTGLTVPSSGAQTNLIKSTYRKCGLDLQKKEHRCQYFEAHGTGTLAGDPKEAQAIRDAFFPANEKSYYTAKDEILYVGSIKTVMGHSEGAAGLAGVIKASLAVQNSQIPPNMNFTQLNPAIKPFYDHLRIATSQAQPWSTLPEGVPRRASVNSFGFGGTNAHAIIESWDPESSLSIPSSRPWGPIVLSARSSGTLKRAMSALSHALKVEERIDLGDLAWTLQIRRTQLPFRATVSATDKVQLIQRLDESTEKDWSQIPKATKVTKSHPARMLGVFTGQGAQWPAMGKDLYECSSVFRQSIQTLQESLDSLPDAPEWTLADELNAPATSSRVGLAIVSQPLCTAIQLALVDLLRVSGISFSGVVGHSSGEIAAAYAAGYLKASDAIRIAYYRGFHSHLAQSPHGGRGAMMAVGMSMNDAVAFCELPEFLGRIKVAACNSKSSVTLSGDSDAINEAKEALENENVFARVLQVDKAYHSHHMYPCSEPYIASLRRCKIHVQRTGVEGDCVWYSSVHGSNGRSIHDPDAFRDTYWVENMEKTVLLSQALERAVQESKRFDLVLEVGPHPALRGPVTDALKTLTGVDLPYSGTLKRGEDDMNAFSDALGFIWKNLDSTDPLPNFQAFAEACDRPRRPRVSKSLPRYQWDHNKPLFRESRASKKWRTQRQPDHELLGTPRVMGDYDEVRWRNVMRVDEMEWLRGHQFQKQVLFPAAGYVSMAIEASLHIAQEQPVRLVELHDLMIHRAITFGDESSGVEVTFVVRALRKDSASITVEYACYSGDVDVTSNEIEQHNFSGSATITIGIPDDIVLPARAAMNMPLTKVDLDRFYTWISKVGLDYSGDFLIESMERRLGYSKVTMKRILRSKFRIHPATLDASFHAIFGAFCYPGDDRMWTTYLPTRIRRVSVPMNQSCAISHGSAGFVADCYLQETSSRKISADVDIFCSGDNQPEIQIEDVICSSFKIPSPEEDRKLFSHTIWRKDISSGLEGDVVFSTSHDDGALYEALERSSYFYLRQLRREVSDEEILSMDWHLQYSLDWAFSRLLPRIQKGQHPRIQVEWESDTQEIVDSWLSQFPGEVCLHLIHIIGKAYPAIARGHVPALQLLMENGALNRLYKEGLGQQQANNQLGQLVGQLAHRYPKMRILEIGGGTGGTTATTLKYTGFAFESYTFTDISPGFFEKAAEQFSGFQDKMIYKVLDIERSPTEQGYEENYYDLILASNVLHATKSLETTMRNCRKLLKPGGRIIPLEITSETLWIQLIFSTLPGWWLGKDEGRIDHPTISVEEWHDILLNTGFSGIESCCRDNEDESRYTLSVFTSQAVDPTVNVLRDPLANAHGTIRIENLVIVSGKEMASLDGAMEIQRLLSPFASNTAVVTGLEEDQLLNLQLGSAVICLSDLEEPTFQRMTAEKFKGVQRIFDNAKRIVWATKGCRVDEPYANMIIGLGRSVMQESPHIGVQFVDFDALAAMPRSASVLVSELLLRLLCRDLPEFQDIQWSDETEIAFVDGDLYIPRILPSGIINDRANAPRRIIHRTLHPGTSPIELVRDGTGLVFEEAKPRGQQSDVVLHEVHVASSSIFKFETADEQKLCLCVGSALESGQRVLVLSSVVGSIIQVPAHQTFELSHDDGDNDSILKCCMVSLVCESLVDGLTGPLWLHDADSYVASVAREITKQHSLRLFLSSSVKQEDTIFIHPQISGRVFKSLVPHDARRIAIIGYGLQTTRIKDLAVASLGEDMEVYDIGKLANYKGSIPLSFTAPKMEKLLHRLTSNTHAPLDSNPRLSLKGDALPATAIDLDPLSIISWDGAQKLQVRVRQLITGNFFSSQKTYFLVGMTGDVGLSLCEWMIDNGAQYIAITSRNPKVDPRFIQQFRRKGAQVRVFSLDISDRKALHDVYHQIIGSMPPVGGVANAAMVLLDKPFSSMTLEDFNTVLGPKVVGSQNLDELFHDADLDFFVLFSSLSRVIGNPGQSSYVAANMFMTTLAAQRRKRGVAASVIDIAMLVGFGYMWREKDVAMESQMRQAAYLPLSEPDLHLIFAEAIESGRSDSNLNQEIHTGLSKSSDASWCRFPRFSHYVASDEQMHQEESEKQSAQSLQKQLLGACEDSVALELLENAFADKLGRVLQVSSDLVQKDTPLMSMGLDSLVAVEIRSWFLKELAVDVPVLRILSSATLVDICLEVKGKVEGTLDSMRKGKSTNNPGGGVEISISASPTMSAAISSVEMPTEATSLLHLSKASVSGDEASIQQTPESPYSLAFERSGNMSHSQEALYFLHEYLEDKSNQNVTFVGKLHGQFDVTMFSKALWTIFRRHEALRSSYFIDESRHRAVQAVNADPRLTFTHKQIKGGDGTAVELAAFRSHIFDLEQGDVMKVAVLTETPVLHHVIITHHHIVLDGPAWFLFLKELDQAYSGKAFSSHPPQAIDIAAKRISQLTTKNLENELRFWGDIHQTPVEPLPMFPFAKARSRRSLRTYDTETFDIELDMTLSSLIRQKAAQIQVTPFHFYLSTLAALLSRCLNIGVFNLGIADANRLDVEDTMAMGSYLNILPLRFQLDSGEPFHEVTKRTRASALAALSHSRVPFEMILDHLKVERSNSSHPLFQVLFNFRQGFENESPLGQNKIEWTAAYPSRNAYDLDIDITDSPGGACIMSFTVQKYLYSAMDTKRLMKWYTRALEGFARNPLMPVGQCPISNEEDIRLATSLGQGADMNISWDGTIIHQVERVAAEYKDLPALKDDDGHVLTYADLMASITQISQQFLDSSVRPGSNVAMLLNPTANAVCCLLATMRCGAVWVPLDLRNHPNRLSAMVSDCKPAIIVHDKETQDLAKHLAKDQAQTLCLERPPISLASSATATPQNVSSCDQVAALFYTSGSTGVPKGIQVKHAGILNQIFVCRQLFGVGREVVLQQTSYGFDIVLDQIFQALCGGGTLIVVGQIGRGDPLHISQLILKERITYTHVVPSEYHLLFQYGTPLLAQCQSWRFAITAGEKATRHLRQAFQRLGLPNVQLINAYGPTECTVTCARGVMPYITDENVESETDSLWPLANYSLTIMNDDKSIAPVGYPGEICISGIGIGHGYTNDPEKSKSKFLDSRVVPGEHRGPVLYRTGDRGRILEDGSLTVLGRIDGDIQVKIRGVRVELDEIVNAIIEASNNVIVNAAVSWRSDWDIIAAFVVFDQSFEGDQNNFIDRLKARLPLPSYMCPTILLPVNRIPINASGKQDRNAIDRLPIQYTGLKVPAHTPADLTDTERQVLDVWREVLGHRLASASSIDANSDFFHVGGNSTLLIKLRALLGRAFDIDISLPELFQSSTLSAMAVHVQPYRPEKIHARVDWEVELQSLCQGLPQPRTHACPGETSSLVVLLTGATGFLGSSILQELVNDERVKEVHCIAIRPNSLGQARHVAFKSEKVVEYSGDLGDARLGLTDSEFRTLSERVNLVIHNGAQVSFWKTYESLRRANVLSTRTLCELAIPRRVPLHFISTASVATVGSRTGPLAEVSVSDDQPRSEAGSGYSTSKWVSEALLEKVQLNHGLPIWIHRPTSIVGEGAPELDLIAATFKYSRILGTVPSFNKEIMAGYLDLIPVEDVSRDVVRAALHAQGPSQQSRTRFMHHCSNSKLQSDKLKDYFEGAYGGQYKELGVEEWLNLALSKGLNRLVYDYIYGLLGAGKKISIPVLMKGSG
ncbi:putative Hybrid PKS-NRPS biosynthetic cluster [Diatrype stigma]|uniref:Hybrid PKS-NRPS biosynthetic cluster n=1 Tax=Diatrype stigma TaxID=117547 RepID=A0AAN9UVQ5_9PEZI